MINNNENNGLKIFFKYLLIGFIISSCRTDLTNVDPIQIIENIAIAFMYNFIIGIWTGLAAMFTLDLYIFLKKNGENDWNRIWFFY